MANIANLEIGDILGVHSGKSFIARGITSEMKHFCKKFNIPYKKIYHHNARVVDLWGKIWICEANKPGVQTLRPLEAYGKEDWENRIDIFKPIIPYTEKQKRLISEYSVNFSNKQTRYDFFNFVFHMIYNRTGVWVGPKGKRAENRMHCSELVATVENYIDPLAFDNPAGANPMVVVTNKKFRLHE